MSPDTRQSATGTLSSPAIRAWLVHIRNRLSGRTCAVYASIIWRYEKFAPVIVSDTTPEHIERFLQSLTNAGLTNRSVNSYLMAIKSFHRWFADRYELPNPATKVKALRELPPKQIIITDEQYQAILDVCKSDEEKATIQLLANTGLRASEAQSLRRENVTADGEFLYIIGKGGKPRSIPINSIVASIIAKYPNFNMLKSYRNALYYMCECLSRRTRLPFVAGPHVFRRYFATRLLKKGVSVGIISRLLGHSSVHTTEIYLKISNLDLKGATNVLNS